MANALDIMNVADAAELLGVHVQTLRRLARQKELPAFKLGRDWRFRTEALVRWADAQHLQQSDGADGCSVLIVDDEPAFCAALARMVERFGHRARHVTDGKTGLDLVDRDPPDVILLDLLMPNMDGPQFLARLRETQPEIPVILVTGCLDGELLKRAMSFAPVMLIAKPVERSLLERTLTAVAGRKATRRLG